MWILWISLEMWKEVLMSADLQCKWLASLWSSKEPTQVRCQLLQDLISISFFVGRTPITWSKVICNEVPVPLFKYKLQNLWVRKPVWSLLGLGPSEEMLLKRYVHYDAQKIFAVIFHRLTQIFLMAFNYYFEEKHSFCILAVFVTG